MNFTFVTNENLDNVNTSDFRIAYLWISAEMRAIFVVILNKMSAVFFLFNHYAHFCFRNFDTPISVFSPKDRVLRHGTLSFPLARCLGTGRLKHIFDENSDVISDNIAVKADQNAQNDHGVPSLVDREGRRRGRAAVGGARRIAQIVSVPVKQLAEAKQEAKVAMVMMLPASRMTVPTLSSCIRSATPPMETTYIMIIKETISSAPSSLLKNFWKQVTKTTVTVVIMREMLLNSCWIISGGLSDMTHFDRVLPKPQMTNVMASAIPMEKSEMFFGYPYCSDTEPAFLSTLASNTSICGCL